MKTIIKYVISIVVLIVCISCKKDNQVTKVTQRIVGADDCIQNYGWSWSNGEASTFEVDDDYEYSHFSFKTKVSGELTFSYYAGYDNGLEDHFLEITINGITYFRDVLNGFGFWRQTNIGNIKSNEIVIIRGRGSICKIKDIKIVGLPADNSEKENPTDDPQWDF